MLVNLTDHASGILWIPNPEYFQFQIQHPDHVSVLLQIGNTPQK